MKTKLLKTLFCALLAFRTVSSHASDIETNAFLAIHIKELHSKIENDPKGHKLLCWTLVISNATSHSIRVSRFSLDGFLNRVELKDTNTNTLHLAKDDTIRDPPPPGVDFSLVIPGKQSVQVESYTEDIESLPVGRNRPDILSYSLDGDVDIMKGSSPPFFVKCHSDGKAVWKP